MRFQRAIVDILEEVRAEIQAKLVPQLERLTEQTRQLDPSIRTDAPIDDAEGIIETIRTEFFAKGNVRRRALAAARDMGADVSAVSKRELTRIFRSGVGVGLADHEPFLQEAIENAVRENARRITTIAETYVSQVEETVGMAFRRGTNVRDLARQIEERFGVTRGRARVIARDQTLSLNAELNRKRQANMGVTRYTWRTTGDEKVRDEHQALDGQVFSWDSPPSEGHPGEPINCRCWAEPVLEDLL